MPRVIALALAGLLAAWLSTSSSAPPTYCTGQRIADDFGVLHYPNGQRVVDGSGKEYYPNGVRVVSDYGDEIRWSTGSRVRNSAGQVLYPGGSPVKSPSGEVRYPGGARTRDSGGRCYFETGAEMKPCPRVVAIRERLPGGETAFYTLDLVAGSIDLRSVRYEFPVRGSVISVATDLATGHLDRGSIAATCTSGAPARQPVVTLQTERLVLRMFREEDCEPYAAMCADPEVMRYLGEGKPLTRGEAWRQMAMILGHWRLRGYGLWAVEERATGALLGRIGFFNPDGWPGFELGWVFRREAWGKGYATEGARRALAHAFTEMAQARIISLIYPRNAASIRVAERLGQSLERRTELYGHEVLVYGIDRARWLAASPRPRSSDSR